MAFGLPEAVNYKYMMHLASKETQYSSYFSQAPLSSADIFLRRLACLTNMHPLDRVPTKACIVAIVAQANYSPHFLNSGCRGRGKKIPSGINPCLHAHLPSPNSCWYQANRSGRFCDAARNGSSCLHRPLNVRLPLRTLRTQELAANGHTMTEHTSIYR